MNENGLDQEYVLDLMPSLVKKFADNEIIKKIFEGYFNLFDFMYFGDFTRRQILEKIAYFVLDPKNDSDKEVSNFISKDILESIEKSSRPLSIEQRAGFIGKMTKVIKESKEAWQKS